MSKACAKAQVLCLEHLPVSKALTEKNIQAITRATQRFVDTYGTKVPRSRDWLGRCESLANMLAEEYGIAPLPVRKVSKTVANKSAGAFVYTKELEPCEVQLSRKLWRQNGRTPAERYFKCLSIVFHEMGHYFECVILRNPELYPQFAADVENLRYYERVKWSEFGDVAKRLDGSKNVRERNANKAAEIGLRAIIRAIELS